MSAPTGPAPASRAGAGPVRRWGAPALQAAVLAAVVCVDLVLVSAARADLQPPGAAAGPVVAVPPVARTVAPPVTLGVPDLGLTTRLIGLRKDRDGALQVPEDPQRAGWYSQGAAPGDRGPAVIVGHVDSYLGPGVFTRLRSLQPGAEVRVRRADGSLAVFEVRQVQEYSKRDFPTDVVYGGSDEPTLRLITCGGAFDRRTRSYRSNVVVFAALKARAR